jgi:hypothetical protein
VNTAISAPTGTYQVYAPIVPPTYGTLIGSGEGATVIVNKTTNKSFFSVVKDRFSCAPLRCSRA